MAIKQSIIALVGKPNVGKSTLFNVLQKEYSAITSFKPQTTRNNIVAMLNFDANHKALLIDTPGYHNSRNKLDAFLNGEIKYTLKNSTTACFLFDITRLWDEEDEKILNSIFAHEIETKILVITKIDKIKDQDTISKAIANLTNKHQFDEIIQISSLAKANIDNLLNLFKKYCIHLDLDLNIIQIPDDKFIASELIRESCINLLRAEIPYSIGVMMQSYKYDNAKKILEIEADIIVEKESQKPIVIGAKGSMIKKIGIASRKKLLDIYDCAINLKLFVKVKEEWRNSDYIIKELGYKK